MLHRLCQKHFSRTHSSFLARVRWLPGNPLVTKNYYGTTSGSHSTKKLVEGFSLVESRPIPELDLKAFQFRHAKTGANYFHFEKEDSNCVFAVGFKTPVQNSNGLPHILEHTTLCGSERYPVRDPFFKMLNRSLATYMNAWTASDYTLYPFASQNRKDYFNLLDIYLDAVFFPKLEFHDFSQEGWRLEHLDPKDASTPIVFKGVVFSEMKGAMSDIHSLFHAYLQETLMQGSIYQHNSGGNPKDIVHLTWPELRSFHQKYYHPTLANFFSYGNLELNPVLAKLNQVLDKIQKPSVIDKDNKVHELSSLKEIKLINRTCALDPMGDPEKQVRLCLSFLTNDARDIFTTFALRVLSNLLLDGSSSPMHMALIDSGLAPDYSPLVGYDSGIRQTSFSIGVQGIHKDSIEKVKETIGAVLNECAEKGFPKEHVEAVLQQMELSLKHITAHFGLGLIQSLAPSVFHGVDIFQSLRLDDLFQRLRKESKEGLFQKLIHTYFLKNPSQVHLVVQPDPAFPEQQDQELNQHLTSYLDKLTDLEKERVHESGLALLEKQEAPQDLTSLPCLSIEEVSPFMKKYPWHTVGKSNEKIFYRTPQTNHITYLRAISTIHFPEYMHPYLPLFCGALTWMGTHKKSMAELDFEMKAYTGGIAAYPLILRDASNTHAFQLGLGISGNAMTRDGERLSNLMQELLFETNFENKDRLATLIARNFTTMVNTIPDAGHRYGHSLAASMVNAGSYVSDTWNGLKQIQFLHQIQSSPLEETIKVLKSIAEELLKVKPKFVLISDSEGLSSNLRTIQHFQNRYPSMASSTPLPSPFPFTPQLKNVFVPTPFPVHYCAMATSTVPYVDPHSLPLQLLAHMLSFHYLHGRVREQGGAYGARASLDAMSGVYGFTSYRDPHHQSTFHHFEHALKYDFEEGRSRGEGLDEAKLSWVGQMDHPSDVGDQGLAEIYGLSPTLQQARRDQLTHIDFNVMEEARRLWLYSSPFVKVLLGPAGLSSDYEKAGWVVQPLDFI